MIPDNHCTSWTSLLGDFDCMTIARVKAHCSTALDTKRTLKMRFRGICLKSCASVALYVPSRNFKITTLGQLEWHLKLASTSNVCTQQAKY